MGSKKKTFAETGGIPAVDVIETLPVTKKSHKKANKNKELVEAEVLPVEETIEANMTPVTAKSQKRTYKKKKVAPVTETKILPEEGNTNSSELMTPVTPQPRKRTYKKKNKVEPVSETEVLTAEESIDSVESAQLVTL